jgi:cell wall-associated NlpC family hydrolase
MSLDPRLNAVRRDLADIRLRGRVEAQRFVAGEARRVARGAADLRRGPAADAPLDSQLRFGEAVMLFEEKDGWAWVQNQADGYVGYLEAAAPAPTHQVAALRTFRFAAADIKSPVLDHLSLGSPLVLADEHDRFIELADGGFVYATHAEPLGAAHRDWVGTAERFIDVPYLWGGRTALGLDCSALAQTALTLAGRPCPRDTYMQRDSDAVGRALPPDAALHRGDLLFSPGHVAIASGPETVVHANAFHLMVAHEPLAGFRHRLAQRGEAITLVRRPEV